MPEWVVFGRILKMGKGGLFRSGTVTIAIVGDTKEHAIKQAELIIDHFHADKVYPLNEILITNLGGEG